MRFSTLLNPTSIAVIGGDDAAIVVAELLKFGYTGDIWGVNPNRATLAGLPCFDSVSSLHRVPELAFIGVSSSKAISVIEELSHIGCCSAVCFAAGFTDLGNQEGAFLEQGLMKAKGNITLLGPNCYGFINAVDRVAMWPYIHGCKKVASGPVLISQSGMIATTLTNNRRSVDFSYVISTGNQTEIGTEDIIEELIGKDCVTGFVVYQEAIRNLAKLLCMSRLARKMGKPVVMLKTGYSATSRLMCQNHTGAGFSQIEIENVQLQAGGVQLVSSFSLLLESAKLFSLKRKVIGLNAVAFTCSGGDAAYLAQCGESVGIRFPAPSQAAYNSLSSLLPKIAKLSNPLDCTTQLWGKPEILGVFDGMMDGDFHLAIFIQDYPHPSAEFDFSIDFSEMLAFANAAKRRGIPAFVCSTLGESLSEVVRKFALSIGVIPLQGVLEACTTLSGAYFASSGVLEVNRAVKLDTKFNSFVSHSH